MYEDILLLHASAVVSAQGALLFFGPSETGKSTMRHLLGYTMPFLADDAVFLRREGQGWGVIKADERGFTGSIPGDVWRANSIPLCAFFRLRRATTLSFQATTLPEACRLLTNAFFEIPWQRYLPLPEKQSAFRTLGQVARTYPGFNFYFDLFDVTLPVVEEALGRPIGLYQR